MSSFTIARILPKVLGLNGSGAGAEILAVSLRAMGHAVTVVDVHGPDDAPAQVDCVSIGSGSASSLQIAAARLIGLVRMFGVWRAEGAFTVAIGTGWDLLGAAVITPEGDTVPGAGIFPSEADHRHARFSGEVAGLDYRGRPSAGYVNQVGVLTRSEGGSPLMSVDASRAPYPVDEGFIGNRMFATRLGGPALAVNPHWSNDIVSSLVEARGHTFTPTDFHDRVATAAAHTRAHIEKRLGVSRF